MPFLVGVVAFAGIGSDTVVAMLGPAAMPAAAVVAGAVDPTGVEPQALTAPRDVDPITTRTTGVTDATGSTDATDATATGDEPALIVPAPAPMLPGPSGAAIAAPPLDGLSGYRWPLAGARITLPFGPSPWGSRIVNGERFHDGLDLATSCGDRIVAAHAGTVLAAGRRFDDQMGWIGDLTTYYRRLDAKQLWSTLPIVVIIDDGNGYRSIYAHFSKVVVRTGQSVRAGALIGYEGQTGRASGCHLHYGLFSPYERAEFAIDPAVVRRMKVPAAQIARVDPLVVLPPRPPRAPTAVPNPSAAP